MNKIKVLIVDDSKLLQSILSAILSSDPEIEVVGCADNPYIAREMIKTLHPDVLTLDVEMPEMDGLTFIKNLMRLHPMPVVMCSTVTQLGSEATIESLTYGAIDVISKPDNIKELEKYKNDIINKVKVAAKSNIKRTYQPSKNKDVIKKINIKNITLIAIGSSTGGIEALTFLFKGLGDGLPPIVVTQHLPSGFSGSFSSFIAKQTSKRVIEVVESQLLKPDHIYIAPGNMHLVITRQGGRLMAELSSESSSIGFKPAVDVMFNSIAKSNPTNTLSILLTGMGKDGAQGMLAIKQAGGTTIAQDEATSVVWGMPRAAFELGATTAVLSLPDISNLIGCMSTGQEKQS